MTNKVKHISTSEKISYNFLWLKDQFLSLFTKNSCEKRNDISLQIITRMRELPDTNFIKVDTYEDFSALGLNKFLNEYVKKGKPVVIKGFAKDWECVKKWNPEYLSQNFGEEKLPFLDNLDSEYVYQEKSLSDIFKEIESGSLKYAKFTGLLRKRPELLDDFDMLSLKKLQGTPHIKSSAQLFIGGKGTKTHIHTAISSVSFIQVYGSKSWYTLSKEWTQLLNPIIDNQPQLMASPFFDDLLNGDSGRLIKKLPIIEVNLESGDYFYNPAWVWHAVENKSTSIGAAIRWIPLHNFLIAPFLTFIVFVKQLSFLKNLKKHTKGEYFPTKWP